MTTNYDRYFEEFDAGLSPQERRIADAFDAHYSVAQEIASLRRHLGLTQAQLAEQSGVPRAEISRIEHAEVGLTIGRAQRLLAPMGARLSVQPAAMMADAGRGEAESAPPASGSSRRPVEA